MSGLNKGLNFYIIQYREETYNLYNAITDKNLLFDIEADYIESFLRLNEPSHPFLSGKSEDAFGFSFNTSDMGNVPEYESKYDFNLLDTDKTDYSMYNPYITEDNDSYQMNFVFVKDTSDNDNVTDETDNVLPFLPEEEE
jgi:hypothetical protein